MLGSSIRKIVILGNSLPRQCGIATFTSDLRNTLAALDAAVKVDVIAMSDRDGYAYPKEVVMEIPDHDRATYSRAANFINRGNYDVLSIQHEYGIFGGDSGAYLLNLIRQVRVPIVTTLHTVLKDPTPSQISVMDELLHLSARVVVMSEKAVSFLRTVHKVPARKIDLIHHGIHDLKQEDSTSCREELDVHGLMLLTFGLLSPDKGIQYVIEAMPRILESYPDATYVVVGATHPHIRTSLAGESYRESLITLAKKLGISERVRFVDRFVTTEELLGYLAAMDVYITPYLNPAQITSGTLAYSLGAGKAVISTPYWYAEELLAEGRGMLVPFRDSGAIAEALVALEGNAVEKSAMERRAADYGQSMRWPEVGKVYME